MKIARKFTQEEVGLIHRTMMEGASKDDVALFVATCERTGLDPFARQIMPTSRKVKKNEVWTTVWGNLTTIDGLRKIAVDTGEYAGQEGPWWCGSDGLWKEVWLAKTPPQAAKVIVHRKGFTHGLPAVALFDAYAQKTKEGKLNSVWSNLGELMIAKCAEALALRKAFPNEMAGLYTADEMAQAGVVMPEPVAEVKEAPAEEVFEWTEEQRQNAYTYLDITYSLVDEKKFDEVAAKVKGDIAAGENPDKVLNRLLAFNDRAAAKKAKADA